MSLIAKHKSLHLLSVSSWPLFLLLIVGVLAIRGEVLGRESHVEPVAFEEEAEPDATILEEAPIIRASELQHAVAVALQNPRRLEPLEPSLIDEETLWLARCIYSETKRPDEQELVAWVVRNRVESQYRGKRSYQDVVLDPYQFSAFNPSSRKYAHYTALNLDTQDPRWQHAINIAYHVRYAEPSLRPFSRKTRHFYSERSMRGSQTHPQWAAGLEPVTPLRPVELETKRFRFFEGVS